MTPAVVIRPIRLPLVSANHRLPTRRHNARGCYSSNPARISFSSEFSALYARPFNRLKPRFILHDDFKGFSIHPLGSPRKFERR